MKTTTKQKLKKILLSGVIAITLAFSNFFGAGMGLVSMFASAEYKADKYKLYDFETSSSWSTTTNFEATDAKPYDGTSSKFDLITTSTEDYYRPATKYDGVSTIISSGATRDDKTGDYAMIIKAKDAPSVQTQVVKENNKVVYDKDNFVSFDTEADAKDGGKYHALQSSSKWIRLYDPTTIASSDREQYGELTETEKTTVGSDYASYLKKFVEKTEDVDIYYGYKSSSITLNANAYYVVTFWAYTAYNTEKGLDSTAELTIKGTGYEASQKIDTNGEWRYYTLFITGKSDNSTSVNLFFYYGDSSNILGAEDPSGNTSGFVVIDNILIQTINQTDFNQRTINGLDPIDGENKNAEDTAENLNAILSPNKVTDYAYTASDASVNWYTPRVTVTNAVVNNDLSESFLATNFSDLFRKDSGYSADTADKWSAYIPKYTADDSTTLLSSRKYNEYVAAYTSGTALISNSIVTESEEFQKTNEDLTITPAPSTFNPNNKILKIVNSSSSLSLGYSTNKITIKQLGLYRVSVWLKATDEKASATVKMHTEIEIGTGPLQILKSQTIAPHQTTSDATNNWMEVVFYVRGNALHDYSAYLTILADSGSTIYVDNVRVEEISSSAYTSGSSSKKLDMAPSTSMPTTGISNGYFTSIKFTDDADSKVAPFEADNWTIDSANTDSIVKGVIPTTSNYDGSKIGNVANPNAAASNAKTNVFAIYAPDSDSTFNMKSSSFTLSSSNVYKIFFSVYADNNATAKLTAKLTLGTDEVETIQLTHDFSTKGVWTTYAIYVRVDDSSRSLKLDLTFDDLKGTVFVKDVRHVTIADIKEDDNKTVKKTDDEQFTEALDEAVQSSDKNTYFLDFMSESFTEVGDKLTDNGRYESINYKLEKLKESDNTVQGTVGIIFTSDSYETEGGTTLTSTDIKPESNISGKVLIIENTSSDMVSNVVPEITHSLSKNAFYKLTFQVKTSDFVEGKGLTIKINALTISIADVDTTANASLNELDGYRTYEVYVRTGDSPIASTYVGFELEGQGYALIADINLTKLADEDAYLAAIDGVEEDNEHYIKDYSVEKDTSKESTDAEGNNSTLAIFFYVLSSLLLVGAIVVALVASFAKKHPVKKTVKGTNKADLVSYNKDGKPVSKRKAKNDADKGGFV